MKNVIGLLILSAAICSSGISFAHTVKEDAKIAPDLSFSTFEDQTITITVFDSVDVFVIKKVDLDYPLIVSTESRVYAECVSFNASHSFVESDSLQSFRIRPGCKRIYNKNNSELINHEKPKDRPGWQRLYRHV